MSILVKNKPGIPTRVAVLSARRTFSIHSLVIRETKDPRISCMTVVVDVAELPIGQMTKQLNKLVNVLKTVEPDPIAAVRHQLLLVKVSANDSSRANVPQIVDLFRVHIVDVVSDAVIAEAAGSDAKVEAFLAALGPYGIREIVRSGVITTIEGACSLSERVAAGLN